MDNTDYLRLMGGKIKAARKAKKITLPELSKSCKKHISILSFIENGKSNAHVLTLKDIADVLEMDVKEFL